MASETIVRITDDLTGEEGASTRYWSFNGIDYEIDLSDATFDKMTRAVQKYLDASRKRKVQPRSRRVGSRFDSDVAQKAGPSAAEIRAWHVEQGRPVSARGRVHPDERAAYDAAH